LEQEAVPVAQGWEPLCRFLGVPVPEEVFPQANTTEDFRQMVAARVEQGS
jgi:Sulfotransferase domain